MEIIFIILLILIVVIILFIALRFRNKTEKSYRPPGSIILEVQQKLSNGENTVSVIKYVREETGLGLEEAKKFVDEHSSGQSGAYLDETELMTDVEEMLNNGVSDIEIIKYVREKTGFGLKDAKDYVDGVKEEFNQFNKQ